MRGLHAVLGAVTVHAALVSAANTIKFINHCPYDVWYWVVGPAGSKLEGHDHERIMVPRTGSNIHGVHNTEILSGGISLKIRDLPHFNVQPAGIIQVEYHLEPSRNAFWYDLSAINCNHALGPEHPSFCPFIGGGIEIYVKGHAWDNCPDAWCKNRQCHNAYTKHGSWWNEPSFRCTAGVDLFVEMCTESAGQQTHDHGGGGVPGPPPSGALVVSPDGTCGGSTGYTCKGSRWGECCSQWGFCGSSNQYCDAGCQSWFGVCPGQSYVPQPPPPPPPPPHIPSAWSPYGNHKPEPASTSINLSPYAKPKPDSIPAKRDLLARSPLLDTRLVTSNIFQSTTTSSQASAIQRHSSFKSVETTFSGASAVQRHSSFKSVEPTFSRASAIQRHSSFTSVETTTSA